MTNIYYWPNNIGPLAWQCVPVGGYIDGCEDYCGLELATDDEALFERNFGLPCGSDYHSGANSSFAGCNTHTTGTGDHGYFRAPDGDSDDDSKKKNKSSLVMGVGVGVAAAVLIAAAVTVAVLSRRSRNKEVVSGIEDDKKIVNAEPKTSSV